MDYKSELVIDTLLYILPKYLCIQYTLNPFQIFKNHFLIFKVFLFRAFTNTVMVNPRFDACILGFTKIPALTVTYALHSV
jgi:hypothetical protein